MQQSRRGNPPPGGAGELPAAPGGPQPLREDPVQSAPSPLLSLLREPGAAEARRRQQAAHTFVYRERTPGAEFLTEPMACASQTHGHQLLGKGWSVCGQ